MKVIELMRALSEMSPTSEVFIIVNDECRAHEIYAADETRVGLSEGMTTSLILT